MLLGLSVLKKKPKAPIHFLPGTVYVDSAFSFDRCEVTNFNWLEYLFWKKKVFGENSKEYIESLPDTNVWSKLDSLVIKRDYGSLYLRHPAYRDHPVVGVSQKQALEFTKWRSDRVFELFLIENGFLVYDTIQNRETYFTIEKYYVGLIKNSKGEIYPYHPEYRLPSIEERKKMLDFTELVRQSKKVQKSKCHRNYPDIWSDIVVYREDKCKRDFTREVAPKCKWYYIHELRGNVSEWLSTPNFAAGGSWNDKREDILKQDLREYDGPNAFTGFRNVGVWVKFEE